jgi:hypothetical protein
MASATSQNTDRNHIDRLCDAAPNFQMLCRNAVLQRFAHISGRKDATIREVAVWDEMFFAPNMAVILVAGKDLTIVLKAHFFPKKTEAHLTAGRSRKQIDDFFREFCNLAAGAIKQGLLERDVICGISLPTILSGYDELIFSDRRRAGRKYDCFELAAGAFKCVLTVTVDCNSDKVFEGVAGVNREIRDNEEIEFL